MHEGVPVIVADQEPSSSALDSHDEQLAALSPRQQECLALVSKGYKTKEIAARLGLSEDWVNKLIYSARVALGGLPRAEAARLWVAWRARQQSPTEAVYFLAPQKMGLPMPMISTPSTAVDHDVDAPRMPDETYADAQTAYASSPALSDRFELVPLRRSGRRSNDLTSTTILMTIAKLTLGALVLVGSAVSLLSGLDLMARH